LIYATGIVNVVGKLVMKNVPQVCQNHYDLLFINVRGHV